MASKRDYYEVLGVARSAGADEIKRAYRTLAMQYHPDRNAGDEEAAARFREAAEAYDVLSTTEKKARYDRYGHAGLDGMPGPNFGQGPGSVFDMFDELMGGIFGNQRQRGPQSGENLVVTIEITLVEAFRGCRKKVVIPREEECTECRGSGAKPGTQPVRCRTCNGHGKVVLTQGFFRIQQTCNRCGGSGAIIPELCPVCQGKKRATIRREVEIEIPPGVENGARQVPPVRGEGGMGQRGAARGDLFTDVRIREHELFRRDGDHLICQVPITFSQAALGGPIEVPTLEGTLTHDLKRGHQSGDAVRIAGKGMPNFRSTRKGDLIVLLVVETPTQLTKRQEELLRELAELEQKNVSRQRKSFFEKIRGLFAGEESEAKGK